MKLYYHDNYVEIDNLITLLHFGWNYDLIIALHEEYNIIIPKRYQKLYLSIKNDPRLNKEKMDYFFRDFDFGGRELCLGAVLDRMIITEIPLDYLGRLNAYRTIDEESIRLRILKNFFKFQEGRDVIESINKGNMDDGIKWRIFYALQDLSRIYSDYADFLEECNDIVRERLLPFDQSTREWGMELKRRALDEEHPKHDVFISQLELMQVANHEVVHFGPQGIAPFNFESVVHADTKAAYVLLGELSDVVVEMYSKGVNDDWLLEIAKLLQESNRFEMLRIFADDQPSGIELSKRLGVSQSTITHHLTNLIINKVLIERIILKEETYHHYPNRELLGDWCEFVKKSLNLSEKVGLVDEDLAKFFKCLSDPVRWEMLKSIAKAPSTSAMLRQLTMISAGTVTHHMNLMNDVGIVEKTKKGRTVYFSINHGVINGYLAKIMEI